MLRSLVQHYEDLAVRGEVAKPGWGLAKVSYALCLNDDGAVTQCISVKTEQLRGNKTVEAPREMPVPAQVKRANGVLPNFLCDNSSYILGDDDKSDKETEEQKKAKKRQRARECFAACRDLHQKILADVEHPAAQAVLNYFTHWDPASTRESAVLQDNLEDILGMANLLFRYQGQYLQEVPEIREAWQEYYGATGDGPVMACLVTGKQAPMARLHPSIKGIVGAQSSGASLVSFNAPSFCSYGKEQGLNSPTSEYAAFAYGAALNHLIADREHVHYIGDTAVLCWAKGADPQYQNIFASMTFGDDFLYEEKDYWQMAKDLTEGKPFQFHESHIDPNQPFYVLGIAPNAARLSVRFFLRSTFGDMLRNLLEHQKRLEIVKPSFDENKSLPLWRILSETVNQNSRDKSASPALAGELLRSVLSNSYYPATLLNGITLRIRADHQISWRRAAIIKAYYLKNTNQQVPKEVLQVSLNTESTSTAYNLGRLFSVLEDIQSQANPGINATIRDRYFNAASATPAHVFPVLINLAQSHLKKLNVGQRITFEKQIQEILDKLGEEYPKRLTLPQQGAFQLGYYHQTQARFTKKEEDKGNE